MTSKRTKKGEERVLLAAFLSAQSEDEPRVYSVEIGMDSSTLYCDCGRTSCKHRAAVLAKYRVEDGTIPIKLNGVTQEEFDKATTAERRMLVAKRQHTVEVLT